MITVIDYGAGNLRSVVNAIQQMGSQARVTSRPEDVLNARALILPGVGAAADTMAGLEELGMGRDSGIGWCDWLWYWICCV